MPGLEKFPAKCKEVVPNPNMNGCTRVARTDSTRAGLVLIEGDISFKIDE